MRTPGRTANVHVDDKLPLPMPFCNRLWHSVCPSREASCMPVSRRLEQGGGASMLSCSRIV